MKTSITKIVAALGLASALALTATTVSFAQNQGSACVPGSHEGHDVGPPDDVQRGQVCGVDAEAGDVDAPIRVRIACPAQFGEHLSVQMRREIPNPIGGRENVCCRGDGLARRKQHGTSAFGGCGRNEIGDHRIVQRRR